ncbi:MAG TPA: tetratricopeptide repeat protein [Verrucomicrobiae bacterium]|nr:tetratricopeptide repeat protein [Verrucomicrobiae bacterium]
MSAMQPLEAPDIHHLSAAVGWAELGNLEEAEKDLNRVSAVRQCHPDVLEVRWTILARQQRWDPALEIARSLLKMAPSRASGWLHMAYALRRASNGGLEMAWEALLPACNRFPKEATIPYNLACYACQMNLLDDARAYLHRAFIIGDLEQIREMALADPDLQPLWDEIRTWK